MASRLLVYNSVFSKGAVVLMAIPVRNAASVAQWKNKHYQKQSIKTGGGVLINQFCILRNIMCEELQATESQVFALLARSQLKP